MLTVSGILNQAVSSVVLDNITVKLALAWFQPPTVDERRRYCSGIVIYSQRDQLFTFNRQFEGQEPSITERIAVDSR